MKTNKSSPFPKEDNENIFEDRVLLETIITDITRLGERIDSLEMNHDLACQCSRRILEEKHTEQRKKN